MEACGSAHHWGRAIRDLGHEARLIPPIYVKPFGAPRRRVGRVPSDGVARAEQAAREARFS